MGCWLYPRYLPESKYVRQWCWRCRLLHLLRQEAQYHRLESLQHWIVMYSLLGCRCFISFTRSHASLYISSFHLREEQVSQLRDSCRRPLPFASASGECATHRLSQMVRPRSFQDLSVIFDDITNMSSKLIRTYSQQRSPEIEFVTNLIQTLRLARLLGRNPISLSIS